MSIPNNSLISLSPLQLRAGQKHSYAIHTASLFGPLVFACFTFIWDRIEFSPKPADTSITSEGEWLNYYYYHYECVKWNGVEMVRSYRLKSENNSMSPFAWEHNFVWVILLLPNSSEGGILCIAEINCGSENMFLTHINISLPLHHRTVLFLVFANASTPISILQICGNAKVMYLKTNAEQT